MKHKLYSVKLHVFLIQFFFSMYLILEGLFTSKEFIEFQTWMTGFYFGSNLTSKLFRNDKIKKLMAKLKEVVKKK